MIKERRWENEMFGINAFHLEAQCTKKKRCLIGRELCTAHVFINDTA